MLDPEGTITYNPDISPDNLLLPIHKIQMEITFKPSLG